MVNTTARKRSFFGRKRVGVWIILGIMFLYALAGGILKISSQDVPVEYRTASVWIPGGAEEGDARGVLAVSMPFQEYRAHSGEFTQHVITVLPSGDIQYLGSKGGILFRAELSEPSVQKPQGFWYSLTARSSGSFDLAAGTMTYSYNPQRLFLTISVALLIIVAFVCGFLLLLTFPSSTSKRTWLRAWLSRDFPSRA